MHLEISEAPLLTMVESLTVIEGSSISIYPPKTEPQPCRTSGTAPSGKGGDELLVLVAVLGATRRLQRTAEVFATP